MPHLRVAMLVCLAIPAAFVLYSTAQEHTETSKFNEVPERPKDSPEVIEAGKDLYEQHCQSCHSADLRGVEEKGPNLLRSQNALIDIKGDTLVPIIRGENKALAHHAILQDTEDAEHVAAYVRSILAKIGSQGRPPGDAARSPDILVGDAEHGKLYFHAHCARCHATDGDLKGIGDKMSSPKSLQAAWLRGNHIGKSMPPIAVTVTDPSGSVLRGSLIHQDDFLVTLKMDDGTTKTIRRNGGKPNVEISDPLQGHRDLLPLYTDQDIHDVTAFLVTLK